MNILFISPQPYPYGMAASKRIRLFAEYLALKNNVSAVICGKNNGNNANEGNREGVKWQLKKFGRLEYFLNLFKIYFILKRNYVANDNNSIMLYDGIGLTNFMFAIIGRKLGYKIFTDIVEDYSFHQEDTSFLLTILHKVNIHFDKKINYFVDGMITLSQKLYSKYSHPQFKNVPLILIPISAENINLPIIKKESKYFCFVYSGSFGKKDGVEILIDAFSELTKKYKNIRLILSGKITKDLKANIEDKKNIDYAGLIPDKDYDQFLANADVLVMSRVDSIYANSGFPFKLGEYLATKNTVIATKVSDVPNYLTDNINSLLAEPSSVSSLMEKMEYAVNNPNILDEIGKNGWELCTIKFNPKKNGKQLSVFMQTLTTHD